MEPEIVVSEEAAADHVRAAIHSPRIGSRLRAARRARGMTIAELASAADLSNGFISLLERDETNASVATLLRICELLGVRIGSLFEQPRTSLVRKRDREVVNFGGFGVEDVVLTPRWERSLEVIESTIEAGGRSGDEPHAFEADAELIYVLKGSLDLTMGDQVHRLRSGDALLIDPRDAHSWVNPSRTSDATVLWIITPASL
ncbi:MAG TPA: XRE family transcriptional regulator [Actinomycetota bacterium]|nr:XRE family transcriptional regulator [Actinomycetota bacterium]